MLIPLVARMQRGQRQGGDSFAAWARALARLRDDWEQGRAGSPECLPGYLDDLPEAQRSDALLDLVSEHLTLSWRGGRQPRWENYAALVAAASQSAAASRTIPADLVEDEFLARFDSPQGDAPTIDEYRRRFPGREDVETLLQRRHLAAGRFVKLRRLGIGSLGEVWEAYDRASQSRVALKLPTPTAVDRRQVLACLAREAALTADLDHPGIINLHEFQHEQDEPLYWMRFAPGQSFHAAIQELHQAPAAGQPDQREARREALLAGLVSACDALSHAHQRGVAHGDLTPANLFISASAEAAILDWGFARRIGSAAALEAPLEPTEKALGREDADAATPATCVVSGTPEYMAPEQIDGTADARSDVFGLGAVLYELLAGRAPRSWGGAGRPADWLRQVREARIARPRLWNPAAPKALEAVCLRALARDPRRRFASAAELGSALRAQATTAMPSRFGGLLGRAWRDFGKRRSARH